MTLLVSTPSPSPMAPPRRATTTAPHTSLLKTARCCIPTAKIAWSAWWTKTAKHTALSTTVPIASLPKSTSPMVTGLRKEWTIAPDSAPGFANLIPQIQRQNGKVSYLRKTADTSTPTRWEEPLSRRSTAPQIHSMKRDVCSGKRMDQTFIHSNTKATTNNHQNSLCLFLPRIRQRLNMQEPSNRTAQLQMVILTGQE